MYLDIGNIDRIDDPSPEQIGYYLRHLPRQSPFLILNADEELYLKRHQSEANTEWRSAGKTAAVRPALTRPRGRIVSSFPSLGRACNSGSGVASFAVWTDPFSNAALCVVLCLAVVLADLVVDANNYFLAGRRDQLLFRSSGVTFYDCPRSVKALASTAKEGQRVSCGSPADTLRGVRQVAWQTKALCSGDAFFMRLPEHRFYFVPEQRLSGEKQISRPLDLLTCAAWIHSETANGMMTLLVLAPEKPFNGRMYHTGFRHKREPAGAAAGVSIPVGLHRGREGAAYWASISEAWGEILFSGSSSGILQRFRSGKSSALKRFFRAGGGSAIHHETIFVLQRGRIRGISSNHAGVLV